MFYSTLLNVPSSFAIILMGKRELVALLSLSSWCLVISVDYILFKYKVHRDTTDTPYLQYNTFERDTAISLRLV